MGESDDVRLREQISNLHSLFVLSMMMTESRNEDEILSLAVTSVASLGPCTVEGAYLPAPASAPAPAGTGVPEEQQVFLRNAGSLAGPSGAATAPSGVPDRGDSAVRNAGLASGPSAAAAARSGVPDRGDGAVRNAGLAAGGPVGAIRRFREPAGRVRKAVTGALSALGVDDGPVDVPGAGWGFAFALRSLGGHWGWLVVGAPTEPSADQQFLLKVLAHQTGSALENAALHRRERTGAAELRRVNSELESVNEQLAATVADLERTATIHEALTQVSASGAGEEGIARTVFELTGYPVAVEDRFGNLRAWAGPGRPDPYPKPDARKRAHLLRQARREGRPLRDGDRFIALAQPRDEILGVLALIDREGTAGVAETFALEHGALVLAAELSHLRGLGQMELRLRGDLVDDLCTGTDDESAHTRAQAIGYDLHRPHEVVVIQGRGKASGEALARAVEQIASELEVGTLVGRRQGSVVLLALSDAEPCWGGSAPPSAPESRPAGGPVQSPKGGSRGGPGRQSPPRRESRTQVEALWEALAAEFPSGSISVGIGGPCHAPSDFPRSTREAFVALGVRQASRQPAGVTTHASLGIYRILAGGEHNAEVEGFVREWLGPLQDYDSAHNAELVKTLSTYLECGGNYDETADGLAIHRSTLRYRLQRIREVSGLDLNDVDARFNLHAATRAWRVLGL